MHTQVVKITFDSFHNSQVIIPVITCVVVVVKHVLYGIKTRIMISQKNVQMLPNLKFDFKLEKQIHYYHSLT